MTKTREFIQRMAKLSQAAIIFYRPTVTRRPNMSYRRNSRDLLGKKS